jgi:hypothetical protein
VSVDHLTKVFFDFGKKLGTEGIEGIEGIWR